MEKLKKKFKNPLSGMESTSNEISENTKINGSKVSVSNSGDVNSKANGDSRKKKIARSMTDQEYEELFKIVLQGAETDCAKSPKLSTVENLNTIKESGHTSKNDVQENTIETRAEILPENNSVQNHGQIATIHPNTSNLLDRATFLQQTNEITPVVSDDEVICNGKQPKCRHPEPSKKSKQVGHTTDRTKKIKRVSAKHLDFAANEASVHVPFSNSTETCNVEMPLPEHSEEQNKDLTDINFIEPGTWVQCCRPECQKWRYLKEIQDPSEVPLVWLCSENTDEKYSNCEVPEEDYNEEAHIFTNYTEGSVVWARMTGYPWWPAMVGEDPDNKTFFELDSESSMLPTYYHVVFFDDKVSRAWIKTSNLCSFSGKENKDFGPVVLKNRGYKREIKAASTNALAALMIPLKDRIKKYSFHTRFNKRCKSFAKSVVKKTEKKVRKRKIVDDDCLPSPDLLDGEKVGEIFANAESVLENIEEILECVYNQDNQSNYGDNDKLQTTSQNLDGEVAKKKKKLTVNSENIEGKPKCDVKKGSSKSINKTVKKGNDAKSKFKKENGQKMVTVISDLVKKADVGLLCKSTPTKFSQEKTDNDLLQNDITNDVCNNLNDNIFKIIDNDQIEISQPILSNIDAPDKSSEFSGEAKGKEKENRVVRSTEQDVLKKQIKPNIPSSKCSKKEKVEKKKVLMEKHDISSSNESIQRDTERDVPKRQIEPNLENSKSSKKKALKEKHDISSSNGSFQKNAVTIDYASAKLDNSSEKAVRKSLLNKKFTGPKKQIMNKNEKVVESVTKTFPEENEKADQKLNLKMEPVSPQKYSAMLQQSAASQKFDMKRGEGKSHGHLTDFDTGDDLELEINVEVHVDSNSQDGYDSEPIDFEE